MLDHARTLLPVLARDLVSALAAREDADHAFLESFARRRAALYASPANAPSGDAYWAALATALAPIGPARWMPMAELVSGGVSLEGGARGLRGLFVKDPSEKERRRVTKVAALAARIMDIVASTERSQHPEEQRLIAMAMASFGLTPDELEKTRAHGAVTFDSLEIFGDIEARTRRDLLRGAWQLALAHALDPSKDVVVRGVAARLELSAEYDQLRAEVLTQQTRQGEMAHCAVEFCRLAARALPADITRPWIEHAIAAAAPIPRQAELTALAFGSGIAAPATLPRLDGDRRRQALGVALATLLGPDPSASSWYYLRGELRTAAVAADLHDGLDDAFRLVDGYLADRTREHALGNPAPPATPGAPPAPSAPAR